MTQASLSPNVEGSTLERLCAVALARFGEGSPSSANGDAYLMLIGFANEIIDDIHSHPYWSREYPSIRYYAHPSDTRDVADTLMVRGLLSRVAMQQGSKKAGIYESQYLQSLNQQLMLKKFGAGAEYEISAVDMPAPTRGA